MRKICCKSIDEKRKYIGRNNKQKTEKHVNKTKTKNTHKNKEHERLAKYSNIGFCFASMIYQLFTIKMYLHDKYYTIPVIFYSL